MIEAMSFEEILKIPEMQDVVDELADPRYGGRSHGSQHTYQLKCRGPLCSRVEREKGRKRNEKKAALAGRPYQSSIHRMEDRDDLLMAIIVWHRTNMALNRIERALVS